jgi:hypothetical protein
LGEIGGSCDTIDYRGGRRAHRRLDESDGGSSYRSRADLATGGRLRAHHPVELSRFAAERKLGPALATGCTGSEADARDAASPLAFCAALVGRAPAGWNCVTGSVHARRALWDPLVAKIAMTGGTGF